MLIRYKDFPLNSSWSGCFYATLAKTPEVTNEIYNDTLKKAVYYTSSKMQVAIDSTDIEAYESVRTNKKKNTEENNHAQFGY